jgi:hypothetical protein
VGGSRRRRIRGGAVEPSFGGTIGTAGALWTSTSTATPYSSATGAAIPDIYAGGGRRGLSVKAMKKALKKAGLKTTGKKAALTRRFKKIGRGMRGGAAENANGGSIPSPHAVGSYVGDGVAGLINLTDSSGSVPNTVVKSS